MAESDPDRTFDADPDPGKNDMEQDVDHAARKKIVLFGGLFLTDMSKNYTGLKNCYLNMENICPNFVLLYWIRFHLI